MSTLSLKIEQKVNQYMKKGQPVFVYTVTGKPEDLKKYKESQGEYYRESDDKKPLYFSQRIIADGTAMSPTSSGRFQVLEDLEAIASGIESAVINGLGKIESIRRFSGLSKSQMTERLLGAFAA